MKKFLEKLWKFVNSKIFGYIAIIIFAVLFLGTCERNSTLKEEAAKKDQNISALNGTIKQVRLKNGNLQSSMDAYIATADELQQYNKELSDEVKAQKGKVVTLNRIVFNLNQNIADLEKYIKNLPDPNPPVQDNDSTWTVSWSTAYVYDSTNYDRYDGKTQVRLRGPLDLSKISVAHKQTYLTFRDSQVGLVWGQKWEGSGKNKRLKVYAETAHPAFKAKLMEGTYVDYSKKQHWFTGFGVGPQFGIGYDPFVQKPALYLGVGIHYSVYSF